ncbi:hypothetical protein ACERK3_05085 [Phycisphaerales bacterium AB-hyl4]|uniref:Zinc ribbon protein n=1 Tax=Natronomicrosphaera hydrolytica TaxID=3242702 RepID=A0ABV4U241_9BACT
MTASQIRVVSQGHAEQLEGAQLVAYGFRWFFINLVIFMPVGLLVGWLWWLWMERWYRKRVQAGRCLRCGYSLMEIGSRVDCPECGYRIVRSASLETGELPT